MRLILFILLLTGIFYIFTNDESENKDKDYDYIHSKDILSEGDKKIALLIGNSDYTHLNTLSSPSKDIPDLATKLRGMNFKVIELYDLDEKEMKKAIKDFKKRLLKNPSAIALFYYSGHGSQAYGDSYLIPIDGDTRDEADVEADGVKVETIAYKMANARTKANILFLDACRDVPTGTMGGTKGLGQVKNRPSGSLIIYSTSKNTTAKDNRLFNKVVLQKLATNVPLTTLANDISYAVDQKTSGEQVPEVFAKSLPTLCLSGTCKQQEVKVVEKIVYRDRVVEPKPIVKPKPVQITSTLKWITPKDSVCKANGGKIDKDDGVCRAEWKDAEKICSASVGRLPTLKELSKVVTDCGGIVDTNLFGKDAGKNKNNSQYQNCYKERGFFASGYYWSSTTHANSSDFAWFVTFYYGSQDYGNKNGNVYVRCVRAGE